jgi:hypothetical protein
MGVSSWRRWTPTPPHPPSPTHHPHPFTHTHPLTHPPSPTHPSHTHPSPTHTPTPQELGYNAIHFNQLAHSWVRDVRIHNSDSGFYSWGMVFCTILNLEISSGPRGFDNGHRGIWLERGSDNLIKGFNITTRMYHDLSVSYYEHSTAFVNGTGKVGGWKSGLGGGGAGACGVGWAGGAGAEFFHWSRNHDLRVGRSGVGRGRQRGGGMRVVLSLPACVVGTPGGRSLPKVGVVGVWGGRGKLEAANGPSVAPLMSARHSHQVQLQ